MQLVCSYQMFAVPMFIIPMFIMKESLLATVLFPFPALLVMTVGVQFVSNRTCIILGSLSLTTANIITAYAPDISYLFVSVGVLEGKTGFGQLHLKSHNSSTVYWMTI